MIEKRVIQIFNGAFFSLVFILYLFVYNYISKLPDDMDYMNPLIVAIIALFFGAPMKATYDILINIYFNFEENIPQYFKRSRIIIHSLIDLISITFTVIVIVKFINNFTIVIASAIFFVVCLILAIYLYISSKVLSKEKKK